MKIKEKKISKYHSETIIENPSKKMMDKVKQYLAELERQQQIDFENRHLYFPE